MPTLVREELLDTKVREDMAWGEVVQEEEDPKAP